MTSDKKPSIVDGSSFRSCEVEECPHGVDQERYTSSGETVGFCKEHAVAADRYYQVLGGAKLLLILTLLKLIRRAVFKR